LDIGRTIVIKDCARALIFIFTYFFYNTAISESNYTTVVRDGIEYCVIGEFLYPVTNKECKDHKEKTKPKSEIDILVDELAIRLWDYGGGDNDVQQLREDIRSEMTLRKVRGMSTERQRKELQALEILELRIDVQKFLIDFEQGFKDREVQIRRENERRERESWR